MSNQKTVMIADDQQSLRLLLRATLGPVGYRVVEAINGAEALSVARDEHPDLVFLDVGMPGMDGYAVCRELKNDPETASIPVIMLSARAQQPDKQKGIEAGADLYLTKPFKPAELRSVLSTFLDARQSDAAIGVAS